MIQPQIILHLRRYNGRDSTIKVRGASKFGLGIDLGVGSVPQIYNLKQATNSGLALFVDASGNKVTTPPANVVDGYFPLYIDEGELTLTNLVE